MFKQIMSDFAFIRANDKIRKLSKQGVAQNIAVIASLLEIQAKQWFSGRRSEIVNDLLNECLSRYDKQTENESYHCADFDVMASACATAQASLEGDVDVGFLQLDIDNKMKILVNLKLLPERFLDINWESSVVA